MYCRESMCAFCQSHVHNNLLIPSHIYTCLDQPLSLCRGIALVVSQYIYITISISISISIYEFQYICNLVHTMVSICR